MFMQFFARYFAEPYDESKVELFYRDEIYSFAMPREAASRVEWNEILISFLDLVDKSMQQASGDKRLVMRPGKIYSVWLTESEFKNWLSRFTRWSVAVHRRPDRETNKRVYLGS